MNIERSLAQSYVFDTNTFGTVGGFPITEIVRLEQQKKDFMMGGRKTAPVDKFDRLRGLVVPVGLFMQNFPTSRCELPKENSRSPTISEETFDKLVANVSKPARAKQTRKNTPDGSKKQTKKIAYR